MLHILYSILGFTVAIAILVTVHEFGHFWVARKCGVKVLRFSVGFGKPIWKHTSKVDGTEYVLALIPLGGYVSMLGEADNTKDQINDGNRDQAYNEKRVSRRMAITLAGPVANFIFAIFAFWIVYTFGFPGIPPKVADVNTGSYAWKAGFRAGDSITEIDGEKAQTWNMVSYRVLTALVRQQKIELKSQSKDQVEKTHTLDFRKSKYYLGPDSPSPLSHAGFRVALPSRVGTVLPGRAAAKAGIKVGDKIVKLRGKNISIYQDMWPILHKHAGTSISIEVRRQKQLVSLTITPKKSDKIIGLIGVVPENSSTVVKKVIAGDPAAKAGMLAGDQIVKINGVPIASFKDMTKIIYKSPGVSLLVEIRRKGKSISLGITPKQYKVRLSIAGLIGIHPSSNTTKEIYNVGRAVSVGGWKTWDMSILTFQVFGKMITREASEKNISGPFTIGDVAGKAVKRGLIWFIYIMAIISLSLGVINLLPIPVLDGGHFMFQCIEFVTGKPVSDRTKMIGMAIGLGLILMLMVLAFRNDFLRLFS